MADSSDSGSECFEESYHMHTKLKPEDLKNCIFVEFVITKLVYQ